MNNKKGKTKVAIVKISDTIDQAVRQAVDLAGGIDTLSYNHNILIKPNALTSVKDPEKQLVCTTHPEVVRSLIRLYKEAGYTVAVGDSSGASTNTSKVLKEAGFEKIAIEEEVEIFNLSSGAQDVQIEGAKKLHHVAFSKKALDSLIVNTAKMKTHTLTRVTLAIKNLFGTVPGMEKIRVHAVGNTAFGFSQCLVDIYKYLKEQTVMHVIDATIAMEGHGPSSGTPVEMNVILASKDAVALDAVTTALMKEKPSSILTTKYAHERGLGTMDRKDIEIVGEEVATVAKRFKVPGKFISLLPIGMFWKFLTKQPYYAGEGCIACLRCQNICPVSAIYVEKKPEKKPIFDYDKCISCFSCQELCPEHVIQVGKLKYKYFFLLLLINILSLIAVILLLVFFA